MPTKYKIQFWPNDSYATITESGGICVDTDGLLDWSVSLPWEYVRDYCKRKGWQVIPVVESPCNVYEFRGSTYEVCWNSGRVTRLAKNGEEINWHQLPEQLKGLL